jgi:hypothetical protein
MDLVSDGKGESILDPGGASVFRPEDLTLDIVGPNVAVLHVNATSYTPIQERDEGRGKTLSIVMTKLDANSRWAIAGFDSSRSNLDSSRPWTCSAPGSNSQADSERRFLEEFFEAITTSVVMDYRRFLADNASFDGSSMPDVISRAIPHSPGPAIEREATNIKSIAWNPMRRSESWSEGMVTVETHYFGLFIEAIVTMGPSRSNPHKIGICELILVQCYGRM